MLDASAATAAAPVAIDPPVKINPNAPTRETVLSVEHYTDRLFSFKLTRPQSFRFRSGEFVMIGLDGEKKPLLRAYSIASPSWAEELEFFSIKVPDGPLTSRLQKIQPGDQVLLGKKPTGTLVLDALIPGKRLYLLATGTGIAPFASVIRDPETYEQYDQVILVHCCREVAELNYGFKLVEEMKADELVRDFVGDKLVHFATVTREDYSVTGRITTLMESGKLYDELCVPPLNPADDRVMICGSMEMFRDLKTICEAAGLTEGSNAAPGEFVVEKAFAG
jgi:ferredoxin--NADP+ reductase